MPRIDILTQLKEFDNVKLFANQFLVQAKNFSDVYSKLPKTEIKLDNFFIDVENFLINNYTIREMLLLLALTQEDSKLEKEFAGSELHPTSLLTRSML
jgi:hypothetical protein